MKYWDRRFGVPLQNEQRMVIESNINLSDCLLSGLEAIESCTFHTSEESSFA